MLDTRYRIEGISPLRGEISLGGAKNAALPCMCAALLTDEEVVLKNVPAISDVYSLLDIFTYLGVEHQLEGNTLKIKAENLECKTIPHDLVKKLRASILVLGPLLARCGEVKMAYPGGCVIGKRPVYAHIDSLVQLGAEDISNDEVLHLKGDIKNGEVILPEFSETRNFPASKVAFNSCNSSPAIGSAPRQILNPLYSGGLWLAVTTTAASTGKSTVAR